MSKVLALILKSPSGKTTKSKSCFEGHYYEYCKTTTVHEGPTQSQLKAHMAGVGGDILSGSEFVDTHLEIASPSLGGTRSGYDARTYFTPASMRSGNFQVSYGYALGSYSIADRTWKDLDLNGTSIVRGDNSGAR